MIAYPLSIKAGNGAFEHLRREGWHPESFSSLVGASGGAKLLGLGHLDRFIFGEYLQRSTNPMDLYGSSIGSWRHAALASADPLQAITTLQERYLNQSWDESDTRPAGQIVDELCEWVLDGLMSPENIAAILENPRFRTHIVTAKGIGLNGARGRGYLALGMGTSAIANVFSRRLLARGFQRTVFSTGPGTGFNFQDFGTVTVNLAAENLRAALLASGSIPFLMSGQRDIMGAPPGHYWDGGIIDYHFDFENCGRDALVLYPHFMDAAIKGWFDKKIPWRKNNATLLDNVVIISPSRAYIADLPYGKIPDRKDFQTMSQDERMTYWSTVVDRSTHLAEAFSDLVSGSDPVGQVQRIT